MIHPGGPGRVRRTRPGLQPLTLQSRPPVGREAHAPRTPRLPAATARADRTCTPLLPKGPTRCPRRSCPTRSAST
ncbi:hypothetical protein CURTO8I2_150042 [Curtobacterium sp. 8I-2]|nr:hypothetical protein CURTO8I2_150042 [Curtobacterium sp. 8I-2]